MKCEYCDDIFPSDSWYANHLLEFHKLSKEIVDIKMFLLRGRAGSKSPLEENIKFCDKCNRYYGIDIFDDPNEHNCIKGDK